MREEKHTRAGPKKVSEGKKNPAKKKQKTKKQEQARKNKNPKEKQEERQSQRNPSWAKGNTDWKRRKGQTAPEPWIHNQFGQEKILQEEEELAKPNLTEKKLEQTSWQAGEKKLVGKN